MKKRAGGNDDGKIPRNRERGDVERERRPGWIIAVVSVTVGLFEYLIEGGEKRRKRERGRDGDARRRRREELPGAVLSHSLRSSGNGGESGREGEKQIQHTVVLLSRPFSRLLTLSLLAFSLPPAGSARVPGEKIQERLFESRRRER